MNKPLTTTGQWILLTLIFVCATLVLVAVGVSKEQFGFDTRLMALLVALGTFICAKISLIKTYQTLTSALGRDSSDKRSTTGNTVIIDGEVYYKTDKSNLSERNEQAEALNEIKEEIKKEGI